jgi:hypothetical protein
VVYESERLDLCLTRWETIDQPDHDTCVLVYTALIDLLEDPRLAWSGPVPDSAYDIWLGQIPGTTVHVLYGIEEDAHRVVFVTIDTL